MKKNEKRICWNCEGEASIHLSDCPYCGTDLSVPSTPLGTPRELGDPFQVAPQQSGEKVLKSGEWEQALEATSSDKNTYLQSRRELVSLLLLLPGVVFCLFGFLLFIFSKDGTLTLEWNRNLAYFYFLGAIPLIFLGWRIATQRKSSD